jgi:CHAD domain-containing protein
MTHYRLEHDETLSEGASRVISELTEEALEHLDFPYGPIRGVHEARKTCKKARGLARLVRPSLDSYSEVNESFRDAARRLGPIRDRQAFLDTFDVLAETPAASDQLRSLRSHFQTSATEATDAIESEVSWRLDEARQLIRAGQIDADSWEIDDDFESIAGGIERTYRRGRKAMTEARRSGEPDEFHEWRKRAKYLWYQIRLLRNAAPSVLRPLSRRLHDVSDALGDAHDLVLMKDRVESFEADDAAKEAFRIVASGYVLELEARAISLGSRLWAEEPPTFVNRLELYWEAWQSGDELVAGEIQDLTPTSDAPRRLVSVA